MAKEKKAKKPEKKKKLITAEEKATIKVSLKTLKAEQAETLKGGDKKKIKAVRFKLKRVRRKLKTVGVAKAAEAAA